MSFNTIFARFFAQIRSKFEFFDLKIEIEQKIKASKSLVIYWLFWYTYPSETQKFLKILKGYLMTLFAQIRSTTRSTSRSFLRDSISVNLLYNSTDTKPNVNVLKQIYNTTVIGKWCFLKNA